MITDVTITPGEIIVVSLELAKQHLRIEPSYVDENSLIAAYIEASVVICEDFIGGSLSATATVLMDKFVSPGKLPVYPVQTITSVSYFPIHGSELVVMPNSDYRLMKVDGKSAYLVIDDMPQTATRFDALKVEVSVGFAAIPKPIIQAVLLSIGDMYERREDRTEVVSTSVHALLRPYKLY